MKRVAFLGVAVALLLAVGCSQAEAGIFNNRESVKAWMEGQEVHTGAWYDMRDSEIGSLTGVSLYDMTLFKQDVSVNTGFTTTDKWVGYGLYDLDKGVEWVLGYLPFGLPDIPVIDISYSVGGGAGWDFADEDVSVGFAFIGAEFDLE